MIAEAATELVDLLHAEVVPLGAWVVGDFEEVAADEGGLVATAFGLLIVGAVAFKVISESSVVNVCSAGSAASRADIGSM